VNAGNGVSLKVSAHAGIVDEDELRAKGSRTEFLDADRVRFPLQIRPYRAGDRFVPLGMRSPKRLNRFFIDEKVPHCLRPRIPLLADADGVLWVAGVRMDERAKLTPDTTRVLKVELAFGPPHPNQIP
jgi:tRNA(Ile)-lysidine synthase